MSETFVRPSEIFGDEPRRVEREKWQGTPQFGAEKIGKDPETITPTITLTGVIVGRKKRRRTPEILQ